MKEIQLTQGQVTIVDDEDYEAMAAYKWSALWSPSSRTFYARRKKGGATVSMHRELLGLTKGQAEQGDHINHNGLDNQRDNLRTCSRGENTRYARKRRTKVSSKYKGVTWVTAQACWRATILLSGHTTYVGISQNERCAAFLYDLAAREYFGEFAVMNFDMTEL